MQALLEDIPIRFLIEILPSKSPDCVDESLLSVAWATDFSKFGTFLRKVKFFDWDFSPENCEKTRKGGYVPIDKGNEHLVDNQITRMTCKLLRQSNIVAIACIQNSRKNKRAEDYNCGQHGIGAIRADQVSSTL